MHDVPDGALVLVERIAAVDVAERAVGVVAPEVLAAVVPAESLAEVSSPLSGLQAKLMRLTQPAQSETRDRETRWL